MPRKRRLVGWTALVSVLQLNREVGEAHDPLIGNDLEAVVVEPATFLDLAVGCRGSNDRLDAPVQVEAKGGCNPFESGYLVAHLEPKKPEVLRWYCLVAA